MHTMIEDRVRSLYAHVRFGEKVVDETGLDGRHRDQNGRIEQKRGDTLNKNLPRPIPQFSPNARLDTMRQETGQTSVKDVRDAAKGRRS